MSKDILIFRKDILTKNQASFNKTFHFTQNYGVLVHFEGPMPIGTKGIKFL
jgi:hypothetical protein